MKLNRTKTAVGGALLLATAAVAGTMATGSAVSAGSSVSAADAVETKGRMTALNNSNIAGSSEAVVNGRRVTLDIDARKVLKGMPHAQHIHFGATARNECPSASDDKNNDFRLTTTDGAPAYGPIRISLTTKGDTSAKSGLAVTRFPTADNGKITYNRQVKTSKAVARAIARGEGVYVVHGVDYNGNGKYDFEGAGKSELDPSLPAEATDPAACAVLKVQN
ncbi:hypothetical protein [Nocardioides piscis]|uniref:CHRD domain-containing protein n=1 Tax=Nocardioides piscis TaxID=2714938 RepID=A0A6G7YHI5_9ACTN|nr:hypothetical protein [Nocardioides piscis]QIK76098.1 hypothetical protein G7071_12340 [Nocardioides piscis]